MNGRQYAASLRRAWRLVLLCVLLGTGAAGAASLATTPTYRATAQLFVSASPSDGQNASGLNQGGQFVQQRVKSYANVVDSPLVTAAVIDELDLRTTPESLGRRISASVPLDTVLIDVEVEDESAALSQRIANAVAQRFTDVVTDLEAPSDGGESPVKVSVVREAEQPKAPSSPRTSLNLLVGLFLGLSAGLAAAVLREALDNSVGSAEQLNREFGLASLGTIAFDPESSKRPLIVHVDPLSPRAEAFRQLRTNLQFLDVDAPPRSIVVTSSLAGEGKSTTTCNLALALTQAGLRVLLVEADLRKPKLAEYLGLIGAVGLTDVLVGRAELGDVLQGWGDGRLQVLPSGPTPPNPSELLASRHMHDLLRRCEQLADLVLIDAPPLLPVTDAAVLATQTSGCVVVVRHGKTSKDQLRQAVENLRNVDAHVYGAVLNMAPARSADAYGYDYRDSSSEAPAASVPPVPAHSRR